MSNVDDFIDDEFDPSPRPTKRRKNKRTVLYDSDDDIENRDPETLNGATAQVKVRKTKHVLDPRAKAAKKPPKPKHRVKIHETANLDLEDQILTQLPPDVPSSPGHIRGAIWQKPQDIPQHKADDDISEHDISDYSDADLDPADFHEGLPTPGTAVTTINHSYDVFVDQISEKPRPIRQPILLSSDDDAFQLACPDDDRKAKIVDIDKIIPPQDTSKVDPSKNMNVAFDFHQELDNLPSDAFDSSAPASPQGLINGPPRNVPPQRTNFPTNMSAPQAGLRQMTIFGEAVQSISVASQANKKYSWPAANREEPPTHHKLNQDALATWVYPTNLGTSRDYQYSIVRTALYHNLLVALPTGLGKTFVAATIMLNWFRWTKDAQIVFVAPTKPLVSQQVEACFGIAGIPRSQTTMLTGGIPPGIRAEEWATKRVFFMTPQTIINDLKTGICDPKRIVLLVVDEAHRATGAYAYVEVVKFLRRFNQSFRILALTATPGSSVEAVQMVIDGLDIARIEIRTESSIDIRQYVHSRNTTVEVFDNSAEIEMIMDLFSNALQPVLNKLCSHNAYWHKDPMKLTAFGLTQARQKWMASEAGKNANMAVKGMVNRMFTVLASLAHSIELLLFHGIGPFYHGMISFRNNQDSVKGGKYEREILGNEHFLKMMTRLQFWIQNPVFIGHPKLEYLQGIVMKHFLDAGEGRNREEAPPSTTRVMVFAHYRDSAEEIARVLRRNQPLIRPHVFVGQAASKGSEGMDQKRQLEVIKDFKNGIYNTLVATSIGEEGLDIGEVDLIICYDASASPIRMLQRMGRTGRKRAGNITLLLMRGKEENNFTAAKDNYEKMQTMIAEGKRFEFHEDKSPRILPKTAQPIVDKRVVEIPIENTQAELPEPKKRGKAPKRPPKKFHMPDGVVTGFVQASRMNDGGQMVEEETKSGPKRLKTTPRNIAHIPSLEDVLLTPGQQLELETNYQNVQTRVMTDLTVHAPESTLYGVLDQTRSISHTNLTKRAVALLNNIKSMTTEHTNRLRGIARTLDTHELYKAGAHRIVQNVEVKQRTTIAKKPPQPRKPRAITTTKKQARKPKAKRPAARPLKKTYLSDGGAEEGDSSSDGPRTSPGMAVPTQGIDLGDQDTSGSDEPDGDPSSQLLDFIARSDSEGLDPSSPSSARNRHVNDVSSDDGFEDDTGSSLPHVTELGRPAARSVRSTPVTAKSKPHLKRKVIEDSSSE